MTSPRPDSFDDLVLRHVAAALGVEPGAVDPAADLTGLGLGSVQVLALLGDLEDALGVDLDPEAVADNPTPRALAEHLRSVVDVPGTAA